MDFLLGKMRVLVVFNEYESGHGPFDFRELFARLLMCERASRATRALASALAAPYGSVIRYPATDMLTRGGLEADAACRAHLPKAVERTPGDASEGERAPP